MGEVMVKCPECGKQFKQNATAMEQMKGMTAESECPECGYEGEMPIVDG